jgi:hypothetical protein
MDGSLALAITIFPMLLKKSHRSAEISFSSIIYELVERLQGCTAHGIEPSQITNCKRSEMETDCRKKPPSKLLEGIGQFNRGEYYDCHETLEEIWRDEQGKIRDLYKGILQIGVAIYHAQRSNLRGAMRLVSSAMVLLSPFAPECMGIDVAHLLQSAGRFREDLNDLASDPRLSLRSIPVIRFIE